MKKILILLILMYSCGQAEYRLTALDNTKMLYHFHTNLKDYSGNGYDLTGQNIEWTDYYIGADGYKGRAMLLDSIDRSDANDKYAFIDSTTPLNQTYEIDTCFTVEMVLYPLPHSPTSGLEGLVGNKEHDSCHCLGWEVEKADAGYMTLRIGDGDSVAQDSCRIYWASGAGVMADSTWWYVAVVVDWENDSAWYYYANLSTGQALQSHSENPKLFTGAGIDSIWNPTKRFGLYHWSAPNHPFRGYIDELCITEAKVPFATLASRAKMLSDPKWGKDGIAVLLDSTDATNYDSTSQVLRYLNHSQYPDVDSIYLSVSGSPIAANRAAFLALIDNYQAVINPQGGIGILGDTSSTQGLQPYMLQAITDYIYDGGYFCNLDNRMASVGGDSAYMADSVFYNPYIWGFTVTVGASYDSIIVHSDNQPMASYDGQQIDTFLIAESGHEQGYISCTAIANASDVDTIAMVELATDRPLIVGTRYGDGYAVQWMGHHRFLYPIYSDTVGYNAAWDMETFGPARGLDRLIFAPLDWGMSRNSVSATFEFPKLAYFQIVHLGTNYAAVAGPLTGAGLYPTIRSYTDPTTGGDSTALVLFNDTDLIGMQYHAPKDTANWWWDYDSLQHYTVAEWGDTTDVLKALESGGLYDGLHIIRAFSPHSTPGVPWQITWGRAVDNALVESLYVWGVHFTHSIAPPLDSITDHRLGKPYYSHYVQMDWLYDGIGDAFLTDTLWCMRRRFHNITQKTAFGYGMELADSAGSADTVAYINAEIKAEFDVSGSEKWGGQVRVINTDLTALGTARWDTVCNYMKDYIDEAGFIKVPDYYAVKLSCYQIDSINVTNYHADRYAVSFTVNEICGEKMPVNLIYTVRRVKANGVLSEEMVMLPKDWSIQLDCRSEYDPEEDKWYHSPGWKARSGYLKWSDFESGWF